MRRSRVASAPVMADVVAAAGSDDRTISCRLWPTLHCDAAKYIVGYGSSFTAVRRVLHDADDLAWSVRDCPGSPRA